MKKYKHGPQKKIICPHCFESSSLWSIQFQDNAGKVYPPYRPFLSRLRRIPPRYAIGPNGMVLRDKICPNPICRGKLPYTAGEQEDLIIGLIGAKYSGKSHFVATLLERLEGPVGYAFGASLLHIDDETVTRRRQEFQEPLRNGFELRVTDPYAPPLLYNLTIAQGNHEGNRSVTLAFCDTAGENFDTQDDVTQKTKYLSCAAGLIFLIDPLQTREVRQALPSTVRLPPLEEMAEPNVILGRVIPELTKRGLINISKNRKLTTPVAVAFTKCDILRDAGLIDSHCLWNQDIHHEGYYDLSLHNDVNGMFSEYVRQWSPAAWNTISTHFADFAFFGLTATGCSSDQNGRYPRIAPWRVEDPLLWLLYRLGVIPGRDGR
jgi:hypothetical protein